MEFALWSTKVVQVTEVMKPSALSCVSEAMFNWPWLTNLSMPLSWCKFCLIINQCECKFSSSLKVSCWAPNSLGRQVRGIQHFRSVCIRLNFLLPEKLADISSLKRINGQQFMQTTYGNEFKKGVYWFTITFCWFVYKKNQLD